MSAALALSGCSGDPQSQGSLTGKKDGGSGGATDGSTNGLPQEDPPPPFGLEPASIFSGIDGTHTFQVPITVLGATGVTLTAADASMVTIEPAHRTYNPEFEEVTKNPPQMFLLTMKKPGTTTLTAAVQGQQSVTAKVTVAQYQAADYGVGETRYNQATTGADACLSCHNDNGGVDHTPSVIGGADDQAVIKAITTGVDVTGQVIRKAKHTWTISAQEEKGLIVFLRSLSPRAVEKGAK